MAPPGTRTTVPLSADDAWHLTDQVGASYVALAAIAARAARRHGVTLAQLVALAVLAQHPDGLGQTRWGRLQGVSRQRAHVLTRDLEARGLVVIERRGRDAIVRFTPAGTRLTNRLRPDVGGRLARALGAMPPERVRQLGAALDELLVAVAGFEGPRSS